MEKIEKRLGRWCHEEATKAKPAPLRRNFWCDERSKGNYGKRNDGVHVHFRVSIVWLFNLRWLGRKQLQLFQQRCCRLTLIKSPRKLLSNRESNQIQFQFPCLSLPYNGKVSSCSSQSVVRWVHAHFAALFWDEKVWLWRHVVKENITLFKVCHWQ